MAPPPRKPVEEDEDTSSEEESSSEESAPVIKSRSKFEDEEDDSDVLDDWEADDSEAEREKAKKEAEAKAKAAAAKKSKTQRLEEHKAAAAARKAAEGESSEEEEDEGERRRRLLAEQQASGIQQAAELFGEVSLGKNKTAPKTLVNVDPSDPNKLADLSELPLFSPSTKGGFENLRVALAPLLAANAKKPQYTLFLQEFCKQIAKDLPSDQIKKIASSMTTLSNERMKEEKAAEKGGKKTKAAKTKASLVATRDVTKRADTEDYGDELADDDFM